MLTYFDRSLFATYGAPEQISVRKLLATLAEWKMRSATRQALSRLDDRGLADVGLTRAKARVEAAKPFWKQ